MIPSYGGGGADGERCNGGLVFCDQREGASEGRTRERERWIVQGNHMVGTIVHLSFRSGGRQERSHATHRRPAESARKGAFAAGKCDSAVRINHSQWPGLFIRSVAFVQNA